MIIGDSVITCDEILEGTKTILTSFTKKTTICETKNFYILLTFLLINTSYYVTNNKLKEVL